MFDVTELSGLCRKAAGDDPSMLSDDELLASVVEWQSARAAFDLGEARALAELQVRGLTDRQHGLKTAQWVAAEAKVDRGGVSRRMRLGMRLRRLPSVEAAVASGELSADHAAVLADAAANPRVGDQVEATQRLWIDLADTTSFVDWAHQLGRTVVLLDQDGGYDPNRDLARNRLRLSPLPDGSLNVAGELIGEQALVVRQCVEGHADRLFLRMQRDHDLCPELPVPTRATLLAMALAELVLRGSVVDLDNSTGPATDVTLVIEATKPARPDSGSPDAADVASLADLVQRCGPAATPDGFHVHTETAASLLCDPVITALIVDSLGVPLDMGRHIRLANRDQRRALAQRDGGCVFPGCDAPIGWCDAHHVTWWRNDGPTDITNLALLCRYHHGVTHRDGWTMTTTTHQRFTWTTPLGQTLHSQRHRGRSPTGQLQPA